jgi:hypothetical protein
MAKPPKKLKVFVVQPIMEVGRRALGKIATSRCSDRNG